MLKALIICQAGDGIGLGHLSRSLVIAKALKEQFSASIHFLIQSEPFTHTDLSTFSHEFFPITASLSLNLLTMGSYDIVILDIRPERVTVDLQNTLVKLRAQNTKIIAIDGLFAFRENLDLIFVPAFRLPDLTYSPNGAQVAYGWNCFLLNNQLKKKDWCAGREVLVLTGGSDTTHLGETWPALLNDVLPKDTCVHWVTGPFAKKPRLPLQAKITFIEHNAPSGLVELYEQVNYAITVYGVSFFELLYVGIPTVVFSPYGDKDLTDLQLIDEYKIAVVANNEVDAVESLQTLMKDKTLAQIIARQASEILRYNGSEKFCEEFKKLLER